MIQLRSNKPQWWWWWWFYYYYFFLNYDDDDDGYDSDAAGGGGDDDAYGDAGDGGDGGGGDNPADNSDEDDDGGKHNEAHKDTKEENRWNKMKIVPVWCEETICFKCLHCLHYLLSDSRERLGTDSWVSSISMLERKSGLFRAGRRLECRHWLIDWLIDWLIGCRTIDANNLKYVMTKWNNYILPKRWN